MCYAIPWYVAMGSESAKYVFELLNSFGKIVVSFQSFRRFTVAYRGCAYVCMQVACDCLINQRANLKFNPYTVSMVTTALC